MSATPYDPTRRLFDTEPIKLDGPKPTYFSTPANGVDAPWILLDRSQEFGFIVRYRLFGKALEFQLYQTNGYDGKGPCLDNDDGEILSIDQIEKADVFLGGFIDCDGCMDVDHPSPNLMMHLCGLDAVKKMGECLQMLYTLRKDDK